ncbi:MAG: hypothetical protein ACFFER_08645 [Candidatus Thorarchaeota archaeon]
MKNRFYMLLAFVLAIVIAGYTQPAFAYSSDSDTPPYADGAHWSTIGSSAMHYATYGRAEASSNSWAWEIHGWAYVGAFDEISGSHSFRVHAHSRLDGYVNMKLLGWSSFEVWVRILDANDKSNELFAERVWHSTAPIWEFDNYAVVKTSSWSGTISSPSGDYLFCVELRAISALGAIACLSSTDTSRARLYVDEIVWDWT